MANAASEQKWDLEADVVIIGSGAAGMPAAIKAADAGASVIVVEANYDVGGHAIISGGKGTAEAKFEALQSAGCSIARSPADLGSTLKANIVRFLQVWLWTIRGVEIGE